MNLKKSFLEFCEEKQFEINQSQLVIIDNLKVYYKENFKPFYLSKIFKKKKMINLAFI